MFQQPAGTTITYSAIPQAYIVKNPITSTNPLPTAKCFAEGEFTSAVPVVQFSFNDGVISGSATDDSASTQDPVKDANGNITGWVPHVYKISGHRPNLLDSDPSNPYSFVQSLFVAGFQNYASAKVRYRLKDDNLDPMPGVWIQERFIDGNPLNLTVNNSSFVWTTKLTSALGTFFSAEDGYFEWDYLAYPWNGTATLTTQHEYFAGTRDTTIGGLGISLGVYTIKFVPGNPDRTVSKNATQTP